MVNVEINGLSTGIYLIELINENQKKYTKAINWGATTFHDKYNLKCKVTFSDRMNLQLMLL